MTKKTTKRTRSILKGEVQIRSSQGNVKRQIADGVTETLTTLGNGSYVWRTVIMISSLYNFFSSWLARSFHTFSSSLARVLLAMLVCRFTFNLCNFLFFNSFINHILLFLIFLLVIKFLLTLRILNTSDYFYFLYIIRK